MTIQLKIKKGNNEIEINGTIEEIELIMGKYWNVKCDEDDLTQKPIVRKLTRSSKPKPAPETGESEVDITGVVNAVKGHEKISGITKHILHKKAGWNKIALVLLCAKTDLTSGHIAKCLNDLGVKVSQSAVSHMIKANSGKLLTDTRRIGGAIVKYKLTSKAEAEIESMINGLSDE